MIAFREDRADSCFLILQCLASRPAGTARAAPRGAREKAAVNR